MPSDHAVSSQDARERGFGAGLTPDPAFAIGEEADGWTRYARAQKAITDFNVRCEGVVRLHGTDQLTRHCNALLALRVTRPWTLACRKCKHENVREAEA